MKIRRAGLKAVFLRTVSLFLVLSLILGNGISSFAVDEDPEKVYFDDAAPEVPELPPFALDFSVWGLEFADGRVVEFDSSKA